MFHLVATLAAAPANNNNGFGGGVIGPIAKPIASVLAFFYSIVPNYGIAILILGVVWMIIISPLTLKTTRSMLAMQKLQPQLKKLQEQHKNDRQAFAAAQMDLFKQHNVSPFGSCLPSILPLPVFFALFRVIDGLSHQVNHVSVPQYLSPNTQMYKDIVRAGGHIDAFGMDLAKSALHGHASFLAAVPFFILVLIMIGTGYAQMAQMMSRNPAQANNPQAKLMKFLPLVFGIFCINFPAGVVLYYGMSNLCRIAQQSAMYRYDPKVKALVAQEVIEVEAHTKELDDQSKGKGRPTKSPAKEPPAPRSRFQKLLANAAEQQAQRKAIAGDGGQAKSGGQTKPHGPGKPGSQGKSTHGASRPNGQAKGPAPKGSPPAKGSPGAKGNGAPVKGGTGVTGHNGQNGQNGQNGSRNKPTNNGGQGAKPSRTGAGSGRTGARGGTNRKRRGR
ncbi:MAG: membrane protein insertase YidC [Actinomycetota bacterium]|nr:membrane protein insertase YidC [Actinomycetota bacterium]